MSSKLWLVSPELQQLTSRAYVTEADWEKCILCQLDKKEKNSNSKKHDAGSGYVTLAEDLAELDVCLRH